MKRGLAVDAITAEWQPIDVDFNRGKFDINKYGRYTYTQLLHMGTAFPAAVRGYLSKSGYYVIHWGYALVEKKSKREYEYDDYIVHTCVSQGRTVVYKLEFIYKKEMPPVREVNAIFTNLKIKTLPMKGHYNFLYETILENQEELFNDHTNNNKIRCYA